MHGGTINLKMGAISKKTIGALQNCRILCYVYFGILGNLPSKKFASPIFNFLLPPTLSRRHLPPTVNGVDASGQLDGRLQRVGSAIPKVHYSESLLFPLTLRLTLTLTLTQMLALWCVSAQWTFGIADLRNSGPVLTPTTTTSPTQKS